MNDMNPRAVIGANFPPDPIDVAVAPFQDFIAEAETWADGTTVETEAQMKAVDALIKQIKAARKAVDEARDVATKPLHEAWKGEVARWKPTQDDLDRRVKCLVALVDGFKRRLADEKEAARRAAAAEAEAARRAAQEATMAAGAADLAAQEAAALAQREAEEAQARAAAAAKDTVKGLRTVTRYEITDHRSLLNWIARNDRDAITAFIDEWARRNHKETPSADGLRVWQEKAAY